MSELTSIYAIRFYELLIAWRSTGKTPIFTLEDFRLKLGVEANKYERMHHFKSRVLDAAIKQINKHTDIIAKYEQHKRGRSITGFSFTFSDKKSKAIKPSAGKRQPITTDEAAQKARPGEDWYELVKRLSNEYVVTDLTKKS